MTDLVEWLRAQLDEDERLARGLSAPNAYMYPDGDSEEYWAFFDRFDDGHVLAEVGAKRRIIDEYQDAVHLERIGDETDDDAKWDWMFKREALEKVVALLALPYADRPGYREDWRP